MSFIKQSKFISANPEWGTIAPIFKKAFAVKEGLLRAELEISALGVYEAYINGERVGDAVMAPGWTEYETRVQYQTYDVTEMIDKDNVIELYVGHGWYATRMGWNFHLPPEHPYPAVIAALKLNFKDGEELILTDESWQCAKSCVTYTSIYNGEHADARIVPEYVENAHLYDYSADKLIPEEGEPIREIERIKPKEIIVTPLGEVVIDFGQNLTGYLEFTVRGKAGDEVMVSHAEILDKDGNFYTENYRSAKANIKYILKDGEQTYKPHYTFFGFRYVRLDKWVGEVNSTDFTAIVVHSDMKRTGYFECGNAKINKLYRNIIWGQRGNFLDVPTDCPQRDERLGWTGDAEVFCRTAMLNYDCEKFFKKWLRDLAIAQYDNGAVPNVIPDVLHDTNMFSSAWGDAATICPYEHYMVYADKEFLKEQFNSMKKWVDYIASRSENYIWCMDNHYGDWLALDGSDERSCVGLTDHKLIATAYSYRSTSLVIKTGKILGEKVSQYEKMLPKIKRAFKSTFIKDGKLTCDTQTAHVLAIHFGLVDGAMRKRFANRLLRLIKDAGNTLTTGFVGTPYLLDTLTEIGRVDKAYMLLLQEKFPSWLYSVNMGATTIWEHWNGVSEDGSIWSKDMNSFNHYAFGSVASWMYRTVCGIKYDEENVAYKHFYIEPIPSKRLGSAKARLETKNGTIFSSWVYEGDSVRYAFTIPEGTCATVTIDGVTEELSAGSYTRYGKA